MASLCYKIRGGIVAQFIKIDNLGRPVYGDCATIIKKFSTFTATPEIDEGTELSERNADDTICFAEPGCPSVKWWTLTFEMCDWDPDFGTMINPNWRTILDVMGTSVGWAEKSLYSCDAGYAVIIWMKGTPSSAVTEPGAEGFWPVLVFPFVSNGALSGDFTLAPGTLTKFAFTGRTKVGNAWRHGPIDLQRDAEGNPGPLLVPLASDELVARLITTIAPPSPGCGCQPLEQPDMTLQVTRDASDATGLTVLLDALATYSATVDWGDGTPVQTVASWPAPHKYATADSYDIVVTDIANPSRTATTTVTVPILAKLATPTGLAAGSVTATTIPLTWNAVTNATAYKIEYRSEGGSTWTAVSPNPTGTSGSITGLDASTQYDVRITAIGNGTTYGNSDPSDPPISVTTTA